MVHTSKVLIVFHFAIRVVEIVSLTYRKYLQIMLLVPSLATKNEKSKMLIARFKMLIGQFELQVASDGSALTPVPSSFLGNFRIHGISAEFSAEISAEIPPNCFKHFFRFLAWAPCAAPKIRKNAKFHG